MATKTDLIEAHNYSRRRLVTALVSGAPDGKELEPAKPLRALVIAVGLTIAVLLAGIFYGLVQPGLPSDWQNGRLVIAKDTGARYVSVQGTLHPVINTASARLLIPSGDFAVVNTDSRTLSKLPTGSAVGIVGAPDTLPAATNLVNTSWTACIADDGKLDVGVLSTPSATVSTSAAVVKSAGQHWVISEGKRYAIDGGRADAVLRAAGINALSPVSVPTTWLNLFTPGTPLAPVVIDNAGAAVKGTPLKVGQGIHITGTPDDKRFVLQSDGSLAELTPLAWQLYQLGSGRNSGTATEVTAASVAALPTARANAIGAGWPDHTFTSITTEQRPCALATHDPKGNPTTALATRSALEKDPSGITVTPGSGALVRAQGHGEQSGGMVTLVDATGTAYGLPGADEETIRRLGYTTGAIGSVTESWLGLLTPGPALSVAQAGGIPAGRTP